MGFFSELKGIVTGDKPVENIPETGRSVGDLTGDITEIPTTPVEAPIEPAFTEVLNEPEREEVDKTPIEFKKKDFSDQSSKSIQPTISTIDSKDKKIDWVDETVEFIPPEKKDKKRKKEQLTFEIDGGMPPTQTQTPPIPTIPITPIQTPPVTPVTPPTSTPGGTPPTTPPTTPGGTPPTTPPTTPGGTPPTPGTPPTTTPGTPPTTTPGSPATPATPATSKLRLITLKEGMQGLKENLLGAPMEDIDYARRGGYLGATKKELDDENTKLLATNDALTTVDLVKANQDVTDEQAKRDAAYDLWDKETDPAKRKTYYHDFQNHDKELTRRITIRDNILKKIKANNDQIDKNRAKQVEYQKLLRDEKKRSSTRSQVGKKLQNLGAGAADVQSGVYSGRLAKTDWFGKEGFLKAPYKQSTIVTNVTEPVKAKMSRLTELTSSTGRVVGAGAITAATTVKANKNIAFMGAPGTVAGARQQFDYSIPARKISLLEVSGISKGGNVNPDILPSLYDVPKQEQISPSQYKQVIQPDGTVANVPVQQRAQKLFAVSVNRYPSGIKISGMRVHAVGKPVMSKSVMVKPIMNKPVKNDGRLARGIESVGTVNNSGVAKLKFGEKSSNMNRLVHGVESVGSSKVERVIPDIKLAKKRFGLELLNVNDMGLTVRDPSKKTEFVTIKSIQQDRKSKKSSPLVNLGLTVTGIKLNKNLNKLVLKNKSK